MKAMTTRNITVGDAAVDGLLGGVAAGIVMAIYLVLTSLLNGEGVVVLSRFDPNGASPMVGALLHLAMSGVYGAVFGIAYKYTSRLNLPGWLVGLVFGIALFVLAEAVVLPTSHSPLAYISPVHFGVGHLVYGLVIGWLVSRNIKS